ncbi:hypothetical protein [Terriglobus aquaticus]|uniref:Uncharacterized protein n=1 Tax=Terriglobus aquaticus TaxID=940139 RepID=A0ABW9KIV2_9BACT|nr:hypothetical protein [Terriglobus aquaticus]
MRQRLCTPCVLERRTEGATLQGCLRVFGQPLSKLDNSIRSFVMGCVIFRAVQEVLKLGCNRRFQFLTDLFRRAAVQRCEAEMLCGTKQVC